MVAFRIGERWWIRGAVAILLALALIPVQILWRPMDVITNLPLHGLVALGMFPEGQPRGTATYGWGSVPNPPNWFNAVIQRSRTLSWQILIVATAVGAYHVLTARVLARRSPPDGVTRCGWCGYNLRGVTEPRCPECGTRIGTMPVSRWRLRVRHVRGALLYLVACALLFLALDWGAARAEETLCPATRVPGQPNAAVGWRNVSASWSPQTRTTVANLTPFGLGALVLSLMLALVAYHRLAFRRSWFLGVSRCGHCGAPLKELDEARCPACGRSF